MAGRNSREGFDSRTRLISAIREESMGLVRENTIDAGRFDWPLAESRRYRIRREGRRVDDPVVANSHHGQILPLDAPHYVNRITLSDLSRGWPTRKELQECKTIPENQKQVAISRPVVHSVRLDWNPTSGIRQRASWTRARSRNSSSSVTKRVTRSGDAGKVAASTTNIRGTATGKGVQGTSNHRLNIGKGERIRPT